MRIRWSPDGHPELSKLLQALARELLADDDRMLVEARSREPGG